MKIEIGNQRPGNFKEEWPGQYEIFTHFEFACGIPSVLFAVTTLKENGKPNVNFNAWGSFSGDGKGFYTILPGILHHTHTYKNIMRDREFVINFISKEYYDNCKQTVVDNQYDADEIAVGGFNQEKSKTISPPRLEEAFMCLECTLEQEVVLSKDSKNTLLIGRVNHMAVKDDYAEDLYKKYGDTGFMFNINEPMSIITGEQKSSAVAVGKIIRGN